MGIIELLQDLKDKQIAVVYHGWKFLITSSGKRYYCTNIPLNLQAGKVWCEDPSYNQAYQRNIRMALKGVVN